VSGLGGRCFYAEVYTNSVCLLRTTELSVGGTLAFDLVRSVGKDCLGRAVSPPQASSGTGFQTS